MLQYANSCHHFEILPRPEGGHFILTRIWHSEMSHWAVGLIGSVTHSTGYVWVESWDTKLEFFGVPDCVWFVAFVCFFHICACFFKERRHAGKKIRATSVKAPLKSSNSMYNVTALWLLSAVGLPCMWVIASPQFPPCAIHFQFCLKFPALWLLNSL